MSVCGCRGGNRTHRHKAYEALELPLLLYPAIWCRQRDSNSQPTDYKSVVLPIVLCRHTRRHELVEPNQLVQVCIRKHIPQFERWHELKESNLYLWFWRQPCYHYTKLIYYTTLRTWGCNSIISTWLDKYVHTRYFSE